MELKINLIKTPAAVVFLGFHLFVNRLRLTAVRAKPKA